MLNFSILDPAAHWIVYLCLVWGLTYISSMSVIASPVRMRLAHTSWWILTLIYCPACTSFWIGSIIGALGGFPVVFAAGTTQAGVVVAGLAHALVSGIAAVAIVSVFFVYFFGGTSPAQDEMRMLVDHLYRTHPERLPAPLRAQIDAQHKPPTVRAHWTEDPEASTEVMEQAQQPKPQWVQGFEKMPKEIRDGVRAQLDAADRAEAATAAKESHGSSTKEKADE